MVYATLSPFIFQHYFHLSPISYSWVVFITASGGIVWKVMSPFLIRKYNSQNTSFVGVILLTFSGVLVLLLNDSGFLTVMSTTICAFMAVLATLFILPFASSKAFGIFTENRG
jgi:hypothetical protein